MCQINFHVGNLEKNYDLIFSIREKSRKENVDLCVFSELCMTGYPPEDLVLRPSLIDAVSIQIDKLIELTKDCSIRSLLVLVAFIAEMIRVLGRMRNYLNFYIKPLLRGNFQLQVHVPHHLKLNTQLGNVLEVVK